APAAAEPAAPAPGRPPRRAGRWRRGRLPSGSRRARRLGRPRWCTARIARAAAGRSTRAAGACTAPRTLRAGSTRPGRSWLGSLDDGAVLVVLVDRDPVQVE